MYYSQCLFYAEISVYFGFLYIYIYINSVKYSHSFESPDFCFIYFQMQDVNEAEIRESYRPSFSRGEDDGSSLGQGGGITGFVVKGGPWEQRAPDTASTSEFPSFGGGGEAPQCAPTPSGAWGPRR
jgi:hypothetical protein